MQTKCNAVICEYFPIDNDTFLCNTCFKRNTLSNIKRKG
ncbi:MAG: hypothetical protein ACLT1R_02400 [Lachnospiraceae bacterium]